MDRFGSSCSLSMARLMDFPAFSSDSAFSPEKVVFVGDYAVADEFFDQRIRQQGELNQRFLR